MKGKAKNIKMRKKPTPKKKQTKKRGRNNTELFFPLDKLILQRSKKSRKFPR